MKKQICSMLLVIAFLACLIPVTTPAQAAVDGFSDVSSTHWAYSYIKELTQKGVINGMGNGKYAPNDQVTRGQYIKLITAMLGLGSGNPNITVSDVSSDNWLYPYLAEGFARDIVRQDDLASGRFKPNEAIDRRTMALWLIRALGLKSDGSSSTFGDISSLNSETKSAIVIAQKNGLLTGYPDGTFRPFNHLTRAEVSAVIKRAMDNYYGTSTLNVSSEGDEVSLTGVAKLALPEGAVGENTDFTVAEITEDDLDVEPGNDYNGSGSLVSIDTTSGQLSAVAALTLQYDPSITDTAQLVVLHFHDGDYSVIDGYIDAENHTITVPVTDFSDFGVYKDSSRKKTYTNLMANTLYTFNSTDDSFLSYDQKGLFSKDTWGIIHDPTGVLDGNVLFCNAVHNGKTTDLTSGYKANTQACLYFELNCITEYIRNIDLEFDLYMEAAEDDPEKPEFYVEAKLDDKWERLISFDDYDNKPTRSVTTSKGGCVHLTYDLTNYVDLTTSINYVLSSNVYSHDMPDCGEIEFRIVFDNRYYGYEYDYGSYGAYIDNLILNVDSYNSSEAKAHVGFLGLRSNKYITPVDSIKITDGNIELPVGETLDLTAVISPSYATYKYVKWISWGEDKVSVDSDGVVTALEEGTAIIAAMSYNCAVDTILVSVVPGEDVEVTSVTLPESSLELAVDRSATLAADISPSNATDKSLTWKSSNTSVATVSSTGTVTAVSEGTATITAKSSNGKYDTCKVTVTEDEIEVTSVVIPSSLELAVSKTKTLTATIYPSTATDKALIWKSSNTSVATVNSSGKVTAVAEGTTTITAKSSNGKYDTCKVTVTEDEIEVTSVVIPSSIELAVSETKTLTATVYPSNATDKSLTWKSSNTSVATVSSRGTVTAVSEGTATITAKSSNGKYDTCIVTVTEAGDDEIEVSAVMLPSSLELTVGEARSLMAVIFPGDATDITLTWKSSNTSIATVSSGGTVTAVRAGTATITAKSSNGKYDTCTVTVTQENQTGTTIYEEDFESYSNGELPDGWEIVYSGEGADKQGVFYENGSRCLAVDGAAGWSAVLKYDYSLPSQQITVEFDAYGTDAKDGTMIGNGEYFASCGFETGWHHYKLEIDYVSGTQTIYIDGSFSQEGKLNAQGTGWSSSIGHDTCIAFDSSNSSYSCLIYVDNISIYY